MPTLPLLLAILVAMPARAQEPSAAVPVESPPPATASPTTASPAASAPAAPAPKRIEVHGHRGCRATRPENTLAAFAEALRVGVDVLELDAVVTKDDAVVVSHDRSLPRWLCVDDAGRPAPDVPIRTLTLAELKRYDCGSVPNPRFPRQLQKPGERIPTLDEVFALVEASTLPAAARVRFNIETKIVPGEPDSTPAPPEFARLLVEAIRKRGLEERVIVQSFDDRTLREAARLEPKLKLSLLTSDNLFDFAAAAKSAGASIVSPDAMWMTPEAVASIHAAGLEVAPWTLNEPKHWEQAVAAGADAIITDDPEGLIAWLTAKGLR